MRRAVAGGWWLRRAAYWRADGTRMLAYAAGLTMGLRCFGAALQWSRGGSWQRLRAQEMPAQLMCGP